ncbi:CUB and sushi domain-containing protein 3-like isoform X2 [Ruditapes philippinarum]|uniref:CUB and sushi domain-containing protein 3-like isoform X2 n=1 Tax=Ruditapes philippinarum TaxID=129788 RepID=UPI00295AC372|nr:CUB and sushi domain-containing protein 3-like isoform X2 [Ruditapes philippinarum]
MNTIGSEIMYTCNPGYVNIGQDSAKCLTHGVWSNQPDCVIDCGTPSSVTGASRSYSSTVLDSIVTYACKTGYSHTDGDLQRVCDSDGNWGGMLPTCTVDCGTPATTSGASKSYVSTTEGSTVTYTCSSGYILIGGDLQRDCGNDGQWSGSLPQCVPGCSELPNVPNSNVSPGGLTQGTQRMVTCTSGNYFATGVTSIVATCLSGGVWSNIDTICPRDSIGANCPGCGILRDCEDVQSLGLKSTGSYLIYPTGNAGISVRCDMDTTSGGWTIIQRRISSSDFYKTWAEYKKGFGDVESNYWLGNDNIATFTSGGNYKIRFDLYDKNNVHKYAEYSTFKTTGESQKYELTVSGYSGTAGDSLSIHNGQKFSTKDNDNDPSSTTNCAVLYTGAWWYEACHDSNLNGMYGSSESGKGVIWFTISGITESLLKTEMKIKRK